jgi:ElaB/YqjD/DUF883 family membrane-anchored ribosome-binding protein
MGSARKTKATIEDIQHNLDALRDDLGILAGQVTELLTDKSDDVLDDVSKRISRIRENLNGALSEAGVRGRAAAQDMKENLDGLGDSLEGSIRERPFTMLALALGLGVVVGTALRR